MIYALVVFVSAFLLFLVQPLIAKQILPWFGGSAAVWGTCLLFFQTALLAGYAYADALTRWLNLRQQVIVHSIMVTLAAVTMPIIASEAWRPTGAEEPVTRILGLLAATIGLPYFLLSTTTPLVGAWYWRRFRESAPYRLFALSNFASLLALVGFPFLFEPFVGNREIAWIWSILFIVFAVLVIVLGQVTLRRAAAAPHGAAVTSTNTDIATGSSAAAPAITWGQRAYWILLSATGSAILLGVSSHLTQNISSAPLLWVIPLSLYLLTFIISFDHPRWYHRAVFLPAAAIALPLMAFMSDSLDLRLATPIYAAGLFIVCMACHGELARGKPDPAHLTQFYLLTSVGGALGSLAMAVVAPLVFNGYYELYAALLVAALLGMWVLASIGRARLALGAVGLLVVVAVAWTSYQGIVDYTARVRFMDRDFYGVVRTRDANNGFTFRNMIHGGIMHGGQLIDPGRERTATSYFGPNSGYGRVFASLPEQPRRVGVIGLGAGALAVYAKPGDHWVFYEISPVMVQAAQQEFTFLRDMPGTHEIIIGDGRLALDREAPRQYDLLAMDAFSGDSIPSHLITREAMALYVKHLKPDGVMVFQATNRFVDLLPVIRNLAAEFGMEAVHVADTPGVQEGVDFWQAMTDQVIVTRNRALLAAPRVREAAVPIAPRPGLPVFTDDYINLVKILKW